MSVYSLEEEKLRELERQFDTNLEYGLLSGEAKRRLYGTTSSVHAKEKWRTWLSCLKRECDDPLFFLVLFSAVLLFFFRENFCYVLWGFLCISFGIKMRQSGRNYHFLRERQQLFSRKVLVLRDGLYKRVERDTLVCGDVLRLKEGDLVPAPVLSVTFPEKRYRPESTYTQSSGKAIVTETMGCTEKQTIKEKQVPFALEKQEIFWKYRILIPEENAKKMDLLCLDTSFFPHKNFYKRYQLLMEDMRKRGIPVVFWTDREDGQVMEDAKKAGILTKERQKVHREQYQCFEEDTLEKQIASIRIYVGLTEEEKIAVLLQWKKSRQNILVMSDDRKGMSCSEIYYGFAGLQSEKKRSYYFLDSWIYGVLRLVEGDRLWNEFVEREGYLEQIVLFSVVGVMAFFLLHTAANPNTDMALWGCKVTGTVCAQLLLLENLAWECFRCFFGKRMKQQICSLEEKKKREEETNNMKKREEKFE